MSRSRFFHCALAVILIHVIGCSVVAGKTFEDLLTELRSYEEPPKYDPPPKYEDPPKYDHYQHYDKYEKYEKKDKYNYCYNGPYKSCAEEPTKISGPYQLQPFPHDKPIGAYCEQKLHGGGWLVIQSRFDGSEDFFRNFTDYKKGFGKLTGEFWYGLEKIFKLTAFRNTQLLIELKNFKGKYKYAKYDEFEIGSEVESYALKKLGAYCGTAGDGLRYNHLQLFKTLDHNGNKKNKNKKYERNCAVERLGAWWYKDCSFSNLNGLYGNKIGPKYMTWYPFSDSDEGLAFSRMMIRGY
ncbi:AAEL013506-PA [Aedes aegypti]|nr:fibrinogen-like protein A [Aedes aegypti]EAT34231.1 AAEL013506-PA [Aedes aegypti]